MKAPSSSPSPQVLRRTTLAATGLALVGGLVAAMPGAATAAEDSDPNTGSVTITKFDDRYADGLFDVSKTGPQGDKDRLGEGSINLIDVNGTRHYSSGTNGVFAFENVPVGPATAFITYPNGPGSEVLFDATGATSAAGIKRLVPGDYMGAAGKLPLSVDADGETRLVGQSALRLVANVKYADGTPAPGVKVELGSDTWFPATEYSFQAGTYEAFQSTNYVIHVPGDLKVRVTAPDGYHVATVTADNNSGPSAPIAVTTKDDVYSFSSTQVLNYFWNPSFTVTIAEDTTRPELTVPADSSITVGDDFDALDGVSAVDDVDGDITDSVEVTGEVDNGTAGTYTLGYSVSDAAGNTATTTRTVTVANGTLAGATPTIGGSARVGSTLTASAGAWTPGTALTYSWSANGTPLPGATTARLPLAASLAGRQITVSVTGTLAGFTTKTTTSAPVTVRKGVLNGSKPRINGKATVGRRLTVKVGSWSPKPSFRYTWTANGKVVKKTSSPSITVSKKWAGKKIKVTVTATKTGYTTKTVTSASTKVKKNK